MTALQNVIIGVIYGKVIVDLSRRLVVLNFGQKIAEGEPREVLADPKAIEAYLGE